MTDDTGAAFIRECRLCELTVSTTGLPAGDHTVQVVVSGQCGLALTNAATCVGHDAGRWKVAGPDWDGEDLMAIVVLEDGVLVVTVW